MNFTTLKNYLRSNSDQQYRDFQMTIIPGAKNIIGVRMPKIRRLAKAILAEPKFAKEFLARRDFSAYENQLLFGLVFAGMKNLSLPQLKKYLALYVANIDNWALCDSVASELKIIKTQPEFFRKIIRHYLRSRREFTLRFALVLLLHYYLNNREIDFALTAFVNVRHSKPTVKMAAAWGIATAFTGYREAVLAILRSQKLDRETHQLAIQKIIDSRRVSAADKTLVKQFRRTSGSTK